MTTIRILQGDVMKALATLPDESVHCVVTSPPYWGLRDYGTGKWEGGDPACEHDKTPARAGRGGSGPNSKNLATPSDSPASICSKCGAIYSDPQIGLEPTPEEYVGKMVAVFREIRRVLRKDGTVWLNMGDSYANAQPRGHFGDQGDTNTGEHGEKIPARDWSCWNLQQKDMVGMPWRLAFALQADGWWLRSDIIWSKPNPMPESIRDRPTKSHEYIFLLAKDSRYFYDADAIREPQTGNTHTRGNGRNPKQAPEDSNCRAKLSWHTSTLEVNVPGGRNRRTVWEIPTQPTPEAHFATFPEALVEPCIKAGTSERGCCPNCGSPWERKVEKGKPDEVHKKACGADSNGGYRGVSHKQQEAAAHPPGTIPNDLHKQDALGKQTYTGFNARYKATQIQNASDVKRRILNGMRERISTWVPSCTCEMEPGMEQTIPCTVLDPFAGSGTVAKVARDLERASISIEINPVYVEIMKRRLRLHEQLTEAAMIEQVSFE